MDNQAIVNTMEVLEAKPITELLSECTIKVCWVGDTPNVNNTQISRDVGKEIASTLPGAPVAGFFNKETGDYEEHSRRLIMNNGEMEFEDLTRPYGFVAPDSEPWYQDFMEDGEVRTYLMCKAYLWTRQYKEAALALDKGQSMELDESSLSGYYEGDVFVFTSATLDKLCILGDAFSPCFQGAKIMSNYTAGYKTMTEHLENTLGRRYYVMNDKLVEKTAPVALSYAVELGWNLEMVVEQNLIARGAEKYRVEGIYAEGNDIYAILQDSTNSEFVRVKITIHADQTVEMASEFEAVMMQWIKKDPSLLASEPLAPIDNTPAKAVADQNVPATSEFSADGGDGGGGEGGGEAGGEGGEAAEATGEETTETEGEQTLGGEEPAEGEAIVEASTGDPVAEAGADGAAEPTDPQGMPAVDEVDLKSQNETLAAQVENLSKTIVQNDTKIVALEQKLADYETLLQAYRDKEAAEMDGEKAALAETYATLFSKEDFDSLMTETAEMSLTDMESKFAVAYAKQTLANGVVAPLQPNVATFGATEDENLPAFMKSALEYDAKNALNVQIS